MTNDIEIWEGFKHEADSALSIIYHKNVDFLFYYGRKFTTDEGLILDVIQDLFYDLIKYRNNLGETDNIRLYLLTSFRRKLFKGLEKKKRFAKLNFTYNLEPQIVFSAEEEFIADEDQQKTLRVVKQAMNELNAKQREILYYKFTLGYDYDQICEIMSITYDSARQLVSRAISSLKQCVSRTDFFLTLILLKLTKQ